MPTCPSCGRNATDGDLFCRSCGHELPAATAPAKDAGGPLLVATFGPTTGWVGKSITYEDGVFTLEGVGPLAAGSVLEYDQQGHLEWAYAGLREWVHGLAAAHQTATVAATPQAERPAGSLLSGSETAAADQPKPTSRKGSWVLPIVLLAALLIIALIATVLEGGYVRDGVGIAFALLAVALIVLLVWSLVKPEALSPRVPQAASPSGSSKRLPVILACLCAASLALAAVLWWMPHYQVIAPTDRRVILDAAPAMTVKVKNHGLFSGTYTASYKAAGQEQSIVNLRLAPGEQRSVTLDVSPDTATGPYLLQLGSVEIPTTALHPATFRVSPLQVDPTIVKMRQSIGVQASVENVGDISGTFPGSMEANGQEVDAQPTEIGPGESTTLIYAVSQDSAGRCRLQLGNARKTVMVVHPVRPPNGHMLRRSSSSGRAHLTIKNSNGIDAMVILARTSSPKSPVLAVYVRAKNKTTVNNVPDGRYVIWDCIGRDWNSYMKDFLTTEEHSRWRDPLVFSTSSSTNYWTTYSSDAWYVYSQRHSQTHTEWSNWTLTLGSGPSKYSTITSSRRFPKL
jgi:hypothetical protein